MNDKANIRKDLITERNQLSKEKVLSLSNEISKKLLTLDVYTVAQNIAVYFSIKNEVSTTQIIKESINRNKNCFLPVVKGDKLDFAQINNPDELTLNKYGIPEPKHDNTIDISQLDIIVLPLVGYTRKGQRIGMGGGYYDKTLGALDKLPPLIALAYSFQEVECNAFDSWDINLNIVVNEREIIYCIDN